MSLTITQKEKNMRELIASNKTRPGIKGNQVIQSGDLVSAKSLLNIGRKNLLINGGFDVWQRGELFTATSSNNTYETADRWKNFAETSGVFEKGFNGGLTLTKTTGAGEYAFIAQALESRNCNHLQGKTLTLSVKLKSSSGDPYARILIGTRLGLDERRVMTSPTNFVENTVRLSNVHFSTFSVTMTVPDYDSDFTLAVFIDLRDTFAVTNNTSIRIKDVQLEEGSEATEFEVRPIAEELLLCRRYFRATNNNNKLDRYSLEMRTTPTLTGASAPYFYEAEI